ncbi:MAG: hypothetical protein WHT29_07020 [Bacteroidales bacterium]
MKRACVAVFTNKYENNFSYLLDFRAQNIYMRVPSAQFKKNLKLLSNEKISTNQSVADKYIQPGNFAK